MTTVTQRADAFMAANDISPVVSGRVDPPDPRVDVPRTAHYRLANGRRFALSADVCKTLRPGYPKWIKA